MGIRPTYTGILGLPSSRFGSLVPGITFLWAGPGTFDCTVHVITANKIRVLFNDAVTDTALNVSAYTLTSLAPPGTAVVPVIEDIEYYDETEQSVILVLDRSLTYNTTYSLSMAGIISVHGEEMLTGAKDFVANVQDPPIAIGAWQSKRGCIDILFNRSVGPTSSLATFEIRDASAVPPGTVMVQLPWAGESIPETTLRIQLPVGMPAADSYEIDFVNIVDLSLNTATDTIPLTLSLRSSTPHSYATLTQLQIIDAFITDVSNDGLNTGNIRVYFNGPVLDANVEVNWAAYQIGVHLTPDTANIVISPDPFNWAQLYTLANEIKYDFNNHIIEYHSHPNIDIQNTITSPDATTPTTAYALINEEQLKYLAHLTASNIHVYDDTYYVFTYTDVTGNLSLAISIAKTIRDYYNNHAQIAEYPLSFSPVYGASITAYTKYLVPDSVMNTISPYTSYADLRFYMDNNIARVRLEATVTSEDGASSTTPVNYTGNITARARGADAAQCLSTFVDPESSVSLHFDRDVVSPDLKTIIVTHQDEVTSPEILVSISLPSIMWAINNAIVAYNDHIVSSVHRTPDIIDGVLGSAALPISNIISIANTFKSKLNAHMVSTIYHYFGDANTVTADDAIDLDSLVILVRDIQSTCIRHMTQESGPHLGPENRMISAPLNDMIKIFYPDMIDDDSYTITGPLQSIYHNNKAGDIVWQNPSTLEYIYNGTDNRIPMSLSTSFIGLATRPSLASAVPRIGLVGSDILKLCVDTVEVFFSKNMYRVPLSTSNMTISGGSIIQKEANWISDDRATVRVINMGPVSYTVVASNLTDSVGNLIY